MSQDHVLHQFRPLVNVLLIAAGYPPEHSGSGGRLHQMYCRLSELPGGPTWSVVTKRRRGLPDPDGPTEVCWFARSDSEFPSLIETVRECLWAIGRIRSGLFDDVDIVHSAGWSWMTPIILWAARRRGIPVVRELTTPGDPGGTSPGAWLIARTNKLADRIVAISPALEARARKIVGDDIPIWCRPNGVDLQRFRLPAASKRKECRREAASYLPGLRDNDVLILQVGRIRELKNQIFLADCVAELPGRFHLMIVGPPYGSDDPYLSALRERLSEPDLKERCVLIDRKVENVETLMQGADLLAFPSVDEGLGTVMIEALCCGLPVVASHLPGVTDGVVKGGNNGYLSPLEKAAFAKALLRASLLAKSRGAIASDARDQYNAKKVDTGYMNLFNELIAD